MKSNVQLNTNDLYLLTRAVKSNAHGQRAVPLENGEKAAAKRLVKLGLLMVNPAGWPLVYSPTPRAFKVCGALVVVLETMQT